jgi:hypothetical protein
MKKLISLVICVSLLFSHPAQANFFTDLFGGLFIIVSYPIQLIFGSTKAPFFVAQNPFVEKEWHKEERVAVGRKPPTSTSQAADNAQQEGQNRFAATDNTSRPLASSTPLPVPASTTPVPAKSIPAKKSVAQSVSQKPAPSTTIESTQTSGEVRDKDKEGKDEGASWWYWIKRYIVFGVVNAAVIGVGIVLGEAPPPPAPHHARRIARNLAHVLALCINGCGNLMLAYVPAEEPEAEAERIVEEAIAADRQRLAPVAPPIYKAKPTEDIRPKPKDTLGVKLKPKAKTPPTFIPLYQHPPASANEPEYVDINAAGTNVEVNSDGTSRVEIISGGTEEEDGQPPIFEEEEEEND